MVSIRTQVVTVICLVVHFLALVCADRGMLCKDHPLYEPGLRSELIRSWTFRSTQPNRLVWRRSFYQPRYGKHAYAPEEELNSTKYTSMDLFVANSPRNVVRDFVTLHFQRRAKVYLFITGRGSKSTCATLSGWKSEGWARLIKGRGTKGILGAVRKFQWHFPGSVYVFSQTLNGTVVGIPSISWLRRHVRGIKVGWSLFILAGEIDGKPVSKPANKLGVDIDSGGMCPDELHDVYKVLGQFKSDPHSRNEYFRTFHPLWDACYWCSFGHEHGSDPISLMGYHPRFGYAALKNYNQDESHHGFKGIVLQEGDFRVYFQVHAHLTRATRFTTRHHTVVLVVTNAYTQELLVELAFKADYGFASTRQNKTGRLIAVTSADEALRHELRKKRRFLTRQMNFINPDALDNRFQYARDLLRGKNEHWFTTPFCSTTSGRGVKVEFRNPGTASKVPGSSKEDDLIKLGRVVKHHRKNGGTFEQHASNNRDLTTRSWTLADHLCSFTLPNIRGGVNEGVFHTDPFGEKLLAGPEPYSIRQFIKPGFSITVKGKYRATDTWTGLHRKNSVGCMKNVGFGINPQIN